VREEAGISPGGEVLAFFEDGGIVLATRAAAVAQARRMVRRYIPEGVSLVDELLKERRRETALDSQEMEGRRSGRRRKSA
jgi:hypothetical protein